MRLRSLRARLVLASVGSLLVALVVFGIAAAAVTERELRSTLDRALRGRATDVVQLAASAPAVLTTPGALEAPAGGRQVAVEVLDADGRILARSVALGALLLPDDALVRRARTQGRTAFETVTLGGRRVRLYAAPVADVGGAAAGGVVLVASDTDDIDATTRRLRRLLTLVGLATAGIGTLLAFGLVRRGLLPLRRLVLGAGEIEETADPSRRLPVPAATDEIAELTAVLNRMLESLDVARAAERRFLADASHELRTPVTALLGNVEHVARHGATSDVLADLRADAQRLARLVDDLLVLEREGAEQEPRGPVRLDAVACEVARDRPRVRIVANSSVTVLGDRPALVRALGNLVENGLLHGPQGGVVELAVGHDRTQARVQVRDEGPGPPREDQGHLFDRFWRAPGAGGRPGSGLGLAIVAATARRHGGTVSVDGSTFTLTLPRQDPSLD